VAPKATPSFAEVAIAHYRWTSLDEGPSKERAREIYLHARSGFESANGKIIEAYFPTRIVTGAAVTQPPASLLSRIKGSQRNAILHVEPLEVKDAASADIIHRARVVDIRASYTCSPVSARISAQWLLSAVSHVLSTLDARARESPDPTLSRAEREQFEDELNRVDEFVTKGADRFARFEYLTGVFFAAALIVLAAGVTAAFTKGGAREWAIATAAGALGACASVATRFSLQQPHFADDSSPGTMRLLGAFRSIVGVVFGVAIYAALSSGLITIGHEDNTSFFFAAAFIGGFAERFAQSSLAGAPTGIERRVAPGTAAVASDVLTQVPTVVDESIRRSLRAPQLENWKGFVSAVVVPPDDLAAPLRPQAGAVLVVELSPEPGEADFQKTVEIRDGVDADEVTFQVKAESDAAFVRTETQPVRVSRTAGDHARFDFVAPREPGPHRIYVQVIQLNRVIQILPVDVEVKIEAEVT
jgi:hypothetical protein